MWEAYDGRSATLHAGADERALVADHVDAVEQVGPARDVADVEAVGAPGQHRVRAVRLRQQQVDRDDLVTVRGELAGDLGADEPGRAGQQDLHGSS